MTSNARRKQRARSRKAALNLSYAAARHMVVGTPDELTLCPAWCVEHRFHEGDGLDPADTGFAVHNGVSVPVGRSEAGGDTAIQLSATIDALPATSTIDVVVHAGVEGDLWWTLSEAAVVHAALGELIDAADEPLDASGCPSWCIRHTVIDADRLDPASVESLLHASAPIPVPSIHVGELAAHVETDVDTAGRRVDEILITAGEFAPVVWLLDAARTAHSVFAAALLTASTDPRLPPAAIPS
ncbi:hypothetical protein [Nocardia salmonicida]|uniref:hypothetical protein n=1 Tax=Nocardia salmonicida TaxID=53431 RepID=UPI0007A47760|nr:hypothetical protein [Nocardia salmonicida]MBC7299487.1 hypothetical protein [Nocardia sp.]